MVLAWVLLSHTLGARRDSQTRTFPAVPVKPLDIRVPEGTVALRGEDRRDIVVTVDRDPADPSAASSWPVVVEEGGDHLAVHVLRPSASAPPPPARVTVAAPRATPVRLVEIGTGALSLSGWRGSVTAAVQKGSIVGTDLAGIFRLETSTGDITLKRFTLRQEGLLRCRTLSGNISVALTAAPHDARVLLLTMGGSANSDLPVVNRPGFGGRLKEGLIGNARPLLSLDAVRGNLTVTVEEQAGR
jgi:hypothetical protein